jgi:uncharacterized protein
VTTTAIRPSTAIPAKGGISIGGVRRLLAFLILLLFAGTAHAQDFPAFTGLVTDAANIIPPDRAAALTAKLEAFQKKTGRQLVVATIPSLNGDEIQDYGYKLGRAWGVGLKDANNGTILVIAPNDRKLGVEVGPGLEGVLTDAYSSVVINSKIVPAFKAGDMPGGIDAGTDAIIDILSTPDDQARAKELAAIAAYDKTHKRSGNGGGIPISLIFWLFVLGFVVLSHLRRGSSGSRFGGSSWPILLWGLGNGGWGGGGGGGSGFGGGSSDSGGGGGWGGGGFTGGGGGSFGGGGASGSW